MKKNLFLSALSLAAVLATVNANADTTTDVTFGGSYLLSNGSSANVGTPLNPSTYTYTYTKSDGTTATVAQGVNPDLEYFTYTDKNGDTADLSAGEQTQADFYGTSSATGDIETTQEIVSGVIADRANYTYINGAGDRVQLGESAQTFTESVNLNSIYTNGAVIDVTDGVADGFSGALYTYTDPDTGAVYHLNSDGTQWVDANNMVQNPEAGSVQEAARDAMIAAYAEDQLNITDAMTSTAATAAAEAPLFADANAIFNADVATIETLDGYYETYTTATSLLADAQSAQSDAQSVLSEDQALETAALGLYNSSIEAQLNSVKEYADELVSNIDVSSAVADEVERAQGVEGDITDFSESETGNISNGTGTNALTLSGAIANIDSTLGTIHGLNAKRGADAKGNLAIGTTVEDHLVALDDAIGDRSQLNGQYLKAGDSVAANLQSLNDGIVAANELTLGQSRAYTDERFNKLDKELSAGVAGAVALSAVEVSNVKKGEVSVGGGYGYYNGESAMALGAAMGLSDSWSVNAGAGLSTENVSFRAGTNYKFKLF